MSDKMNAVVMTAVGGPEVLQWRSVARPHISHPREILVRVMATGVNPADLRIRKRLPPMTDWEVPAEGIILGLEGSGVVEAVGAEVSRFRPGDEVYYADGGYINVQGSYAQFKVLDERYVARKPRSLSFAQAAVLPVVAITTWEALYDRVGLKSGESLLVQGGLGGLGHIGIQLGVLRGARVAVTVSTPAKAALARKLGAECVILYKDEDVGTAVRAWSGKDGADVIYDTVGDGVFVPSFDLLATYGRLVSAAYPTAWPREGIFSTALKNVSVTFEAMGHALAHPGLRAEQTRILEAVAKTVDEGKLQVLLDRSYPLADAAKAQDALERGEIIGRLALEIAH
ncbi:zinc-binding dehydrogenase [Melittangium boletus]|uniref:zinc-binding dehydrogenase n=1 Tax=Melittangium boletus TaxID=83453 RepID=UPI003DA46EA0